MDLYQYFAKELDCLESDLRYRSYISWPAASVRHCKVAADDAHRGRGQTLSFEAPLPARRPLNKNTAAPDKCPGRFASGMGVHFCFCVKNAEGPSAHRRRHFPLWKGPLLCLRPRAATQYRPPQPPAEKFPFRRAFAFPRTVRRHFFAPARDVKAAASPRPPNFHGPIGKTAGQVYQTTISDSGISFAGITPESPGTVGNITDGSGCGTASVAEACRRVRAPIKLTEYGAHAIGSSKKVWGSFAGEPGSKTVLPRGKDVHHTCFAFSGIFCFTRTWCL